MNLTQEAERVDRETGVREVAGYFGHGQARLFGFAHVPASTVSAGVVISSPLYAEFLRNYRREVLIGRLLASRGIAVQRFHYRGHGNSGGDPAGATFETMREDTIMAAEHLAAKVGVERLGFFGTRWGGLIAGAGASQFGGSPLALWDPILNSSQYFSDMLRAFRIQALRAADSSTESAEELLGRLNDEGVIQLLGYSVHRSLYESSRGRTLEDEVEGVSRPLFILQLGRDPRLERGLAELAVRWERMGSAVERRSVGRPEPWWFTAGALVKNEDLTRPIELTVDWLDRTLASP